MNRKSIRQFVKDAPEPKRVASSTGNRAIFLKKKPQYATHLLDLPDDMIEGIVAKLSAYDAGNLRRCSRRLCVLLDRLPLSFETSSRWRWNADVVCDLLVRMHQQQRLIYSITLKDHEIDPSRLDYIITPYLRQLLLPRTKVPAAVLKPLSSLTSIELGGIDGGFCELLNTLANPSLLTDIRLLFECLSDADVLTLVARCPDLVSLSCSYSIPRPSLGLLSQLRSLTLRACGPSAENGEQLLRILGTLLLLESFALFGSVHPIVGEEVEEFCRTHRFLCELRLVDVQITNLFSAEPDICPRLRLLQLQTKRCPRLDLPLLETLSLGQLDQPATWRLPALRSLTLSQRCRISQQHVKLLTALPQLRVLSIASALPDHQFSEEITPVPQWIEVLTLCGPTMRVLRLPCGPYDDQIVHALRRCTGLLEFEGGGFAGDISRHLPASLQCVTLRDVTLSAAGLKLFARRARDLRQLRIVHMTEVVSDAVSDGTMREIAAVCAKLQTMLVNGVNWARGVNM